MPVLVQAGALNCRAVRLIGDARLSVRRAPSRPLEDATAEEVLWPNRRPADRAVEALLKIKSAQSSRDGCRVRRAAESAPTTGAMGLTVVDFEYGRPVHGVRPSKRNGGYAVRAL